MLQRIYQGTSKTSGWSYQKLKNSVKQFNKKISKLINGDITRIFLSLIDFYDKETKQQELLSLLLEKESQEITKYLTQTKEQQKSFETKVENSIIKFSKIKSSFERSKKSFSKAIKSEESEVVSARRVFHSVRKSNMELKKKEKKVKEKYDNIIKKRATRAKSDNHYIQCLNSLKKGLEVHTYEMKAHLASFELGEKTRIHRMKKSLTLIVGYDQHRSDQFKCYAEEAKMEIERFDADKLRQRFIQGNFTETSEKGFVLPYYHVWPYNNFVALNGEQERKSNDFEKLGETCFKKNRFEEAVFWFFQHQKYKLNGHVCTNAENAKKKIEKK